MTWKSRIIHLRDTRMCFERVAYSKRAGALVSYAQYQCFQAAIEQKTGMRIQRAAKMIEPVRDPVDPRLRSDDGAGDDIAVAVQVFRAAMQHEIEASFQRTEVDRRREGVVDQRDETMGL